MRTKLLSPWAIALPCAFWPAVATATTVFELSSLATAVTYDTTNDTTGVTEDVNDDFARSDDPGGLPNSLSVSSSVNGIGGSGAYSSASIDYASGALKAYALSDPRDSTDSAASVFATGEAELTDEITFTVAETVLDPVDVSVIWRIDREVDDFGFLDDPRLEGNHTSTGSVTSIFSLANFSGSSVGGTHRFDESGSSTFSGSITLLAPGSYTYRLRFLLRAQADNSVVLGPGQTFDQLTAYGGLADAGNTGYLNILTPEGVTYESGGDGFLSAAPDLTRAEVVPAPPAGLT